MKLSELIFETQILLEEETFVVRKTPNGKKWGVYNTTSGTSVFVSSHKEEGQAKRAAEKLRNPTPPKPKDTNTTKTKKSETNKNANKSKAKAPATPNTKNINFKSGLSMVGDKFYYYLPDEKNAVILDNKNDAKIFQALVDELVDEGKTPDQITKATNATNISKTLSDRSLSLSKIPSPVEIKTRSFTGKTIQEFKNFFEKGNATNTKIANFVNKSKIMRFFIGAIQKLGPLSAPFGLFLGAMMAIAEIEAEIASGQGNEQELNTEADIIRGQLLILLVAGIIPYLRVARAVSVILNILKTAIRLGAVTVAGTATVATGGAAAPVAGAGIGLTFIITEALSWAAILVLSMPQTHRAIAQVIAGTVLGEYVGNVGAFVNDVLGDLDQQFEGKFGTGFLKDALTTEKKTIGGVDGEYYGNSEWAKLVFGALLFPEGEDTKLVPYIGEQKREDLLKAALSIEDVPQQPATPQSNEPSEPGLPVNPDAPPGPQ
jgi:hypothetical protein